MILFSPAKINIGLQVLRKREDGYHDISSLMYPIPFRDIMEIQLASESEESYSWSQSGIRIPGPKEDNLCFKAWQAYSGFCKEIPIRLHLHKLIPAGAGLGGGSSNGATVLLGLNKLNDTRLNESELMLLASRLGSDCSIFIKGKPCLAQGRGEILSPSAVDLTGKYLVILHPGIHVNTRIAYSQVSPDSNRAGLEELLQGPVEGWKETITNDFEDSVFDHFPLLKELKSAFYRKGALYASMSGSGSSIYGIFPKKPALNKNLNNLLAWEGIL